MGCVLAQECVCVRVACVGGCVCVCGCAVPHIQLFSDDHVSLPFYTALYTGECSVGSICVIWCSRILIEDAWLTKPSCRFCFRPRLRDGLLVLIAGRGGPLDEVEDANCPYASFACSLEF